MYMRGYAMRTGKSIGVLDRLYCRALCLRVDGEIFVWVTLDLCRLEELISDYVRGVVAAKYSVPVEHVILSTIHNPLRPGHQLRGRGGGPEPEKGGLPELSGEPCAGCGGRVL